MVFDRGRVGAVVNNRAGRLDVIRVGGNRLKLILLEPFRLGLAGDNGSADLAKHGEKIKMVISSQGEKGEGEPERWSECRTG